jgi:hypothetical protein
MKIDFGLKCVLPVEFIAQSRIRTGHKFLDEVFRLCRKQLEFDFLFPASNRLRTTDLPRTEASVDLCGQRRSSLCLRITHLGDRRRLSRDEFYFDAHSEPKLSPNSEARQHREDVPLASDSGKTFSLCTLLVCQLSHRSGTPGSGC